MRRSKRTKAQRKVRTVKKEKDNINELAWKFARAMAKIPVDKSNCNHKVWCKECKQAYCLGFDMVDQFCRDCFYKNGCVKEIQGDRTCQHCER